MATTPLLIGEAFSPWTQKARWALEACDCPFDYHEYVPLLGEPGLRRRTGNWRGPVTVPVLVTGKGVLRDSWAIASYASARDGGSRLGDFAIIEPWNRLSDAALAEARMRVLMKILQDPLALDEAAATAPPAPNVLLRPMVKGAIVRLQRKYAHLEQPGALLHALVQTRNRLHAMQGDYLLGEFSYADIAMLVVLEFIAPCAAIDPPMGAATKRCWSDPDLADRFSDLLAWRDRIARSPHAYSQLRPLAVGHAPVASR